MMKLTLSQVHVSRKPWEHVLLDSTPGDLRHRCSCSMSKDMSRKVHVIKILVYPLFRDNTV